jgi:XTP/dITP diphosphohydrolase
MTTPSTGLDDLVGVVATLLAEGGCPWDREQTHQTLVPYLLEEVFELVEALESGSSEHIIEELGDVLYQVVFHAAIGTRNTDNPFDLTMVADQVAQKMRERHPHVFDHPGATTVAEVKERWAEIKAQQKGNRASVLEGIPEKLSALARAQSVISRSAGLATVSGTSQLDTGETAEDFGALLLQMVARAEKLGIDAETALRQATRDFEQVVLAAQAQPNGLATPGETD